MRAKKKSLVNHMRILIALKNTPQSSKCLMITDSYCLEPLTANSP